MRYFANPSTTAVRDAMTAGQLGTITTPAQRNPLPPGVRWCADNGCFTGTYPGDDAYLDWLSGHREVAGRCVFAVAPDVVADAAATLARSAAMLDRIRETGFPVALVAQDGQEHLPLPWDAFDVLFIGGSTGWKLSRAAAHLAAQARHRDRWVHMGRVNSLRRLRYAQAIGCDSVDGTYLTYGPDINLPRLLGWLRELDRQPSLFDAAPAGR